MTLYGKQKHNFIYICLFGRYVKKIQTGVGIKLRTWGEEYVERCFHNSKITIPVEGKPKTNFQITLHA